MSIVLKQFDLENDFLKVVQHHQLTVFRDDGVYRHLIFKKPGDSNCWFQITTWPQFLCISGDMGCYVFNRLEDMFCFFRNRDLKINPSYWGEKVEAGKVKAYSSEQARDSILASFHQWADDYRESKGWEVEEVTEELKAEIEAHIAEQRERLSDEILDYCDDRFSNYQAIRDYEEISGCFDFVDFFDSWDPLEDYEYHYIWCLFAIVWGIGQYDAFKDLQVAVKQIEVDLASDDEILLQQQNHALKDDLTIWRIIALAAIGALFAMWWHA